MKLKTSSEAKAIIFGVVTYFTLILLTRAEILAPANESLYQLGYGLLSLLMVPVFYLVFTLIEKNKK